MIEEETPVEAVRSFFGGGVSTACDEKMSDQHVCFKLLEKIQDNTQDEVENNHRGC